MEDLPKVKKIRAGHTPSHTMHVCVRERRQNREEEGSGRHKPKDQEQIGGLAIVEQIVDLYV